MTLRQYNIYKKPPYSYENTAAMVSYTNVKEITG